MLSTYFPCYSSISFLICIFFAMAKSQQLDGGLENQDSESKEIQDLLKKSVAKINAESNGIYQLVPIKILSAQSQIVAGTLYHLKIIVGQSTCTKTSASSAEDDCAYEGNKDARKVYNVKIWQKPWENFEQITYEEDKGGNNEE